MLAILNFKADEDTGRRNCYYFSPNKVESNENANLSGDSADSSSFFLLGYACCPQAFLDDTTVCSLLGRYGLFHHRGLAKRGVLPSTNILLLTNTLVASFSAIHGSQTLLFWNIMRWWLYVTGDRTSRIGQMHSKHRRFRSPVHPTTTHCPPSHCNQPPPR
uniref:Uncharacterized protein n=1 Tax=Grammatophora oceanica TaxID=210454 RepID=A0A7S1VUP0_9STRA|mmetsp:Transcript_8237/g.12008  ORF Transcript_8237/g.12008 Transcript_8237/m.12008 type:complete len:161 (+) Transcript_8237:137-619(+)